MFYSTICRLALFFFFLSEISFSQWKLLYPDIPSDNINDILFLNDTTGFFVNSGGSVYMTSDGGDSWKVQAHYQRNTFSEVKFINSNVGFAVSPYSYIGDDISFIYTFDGGKHWGQGNVYLGDAITFLPISESAVIKSMSNGSIKKLDNFFGNWVTTYPMPYFFGGDVGVPYGEIVQFHRLSSGRILALGSSVNAEKAGVISDSVSFILKSDDDGSTWDTLWCALSYASHTFTFFNDSVGWLSAGKHSIYKTTDGGSTWLLQYEDETEDQAINSISSPDGVHVFAIDRSGQVIVSNNKGEQWQQIRDGNYTGYPFKIKFINASKGFIVGPDFLVTNNGGETWQKVSKSLKGNLRKIDFANTRIGMGVGENRIYKTADGGATWNVVYESPTQSFSYVDMVDSLHVWITGYDSLYKSTDGGSSWQSMKLNNAIQHMRGVQFLDSNVGVIFEVWEHTTDTTFNYVTTDGGETWKKYAIGVPFFPSFFKIKFTDPGHLWFTNQYGVWLSRDTAKTWQSFAVGDAFYSFDFIDSLHGWVSLWGGLFKKMALTTNGGVSWETVNKPYAVQTQDVMMYNYFGSLNIMIAGYDGSLIRFIQGDPYTYEISTYTSNTINSFASYVDGNMLHLWAAGDGMTVLHYQDIITEVTEKKNQEIATFSLSQNYPNPFNPSTTIEYQLPQKTFVSLKIYDVLGREVATLVNEEKGAGVFKATWNASHYSSGLYFARMTAGQFTSTRKLLLMK